MGRLRALEAWERAVVTQECAAATPRTAVRAVKVQSNQTPRNGWGSMKSEAFRPWKLCVPSDDFG